MDLVTGDPAADALLANRAKHAAIYFLQGLQGKKEAMSVVDRKGNNSLAAFCFPAGGSKAECSHQVGAVFCNGYGLNCICFNSLVACLVSKQHQDGAL